MMKKNGMSLIGKMFTTAMIAFTLVATGCSGSTARDLKLDKEAARKALQAFLESWTKGETAEGLKSKSPSIVGRDPAWESGAKLVSFKLGDESDDGTNLRVTTELTLAEGGPQSVTYIVGTSPVVTVFRNE